MHNDRKQMISDAGNFLRDAAEHGDVRNLLDEGTDPNAKDASESTPLHYAAKKRDLEMVGPPRVRDRSKRQRRL